MGVGAQGARGSPKAAPGPGGGNWSHEACGHPCTSVLPFILTRSFYVGVPILQGTNSCPQAHLKRGCEPVGGASILSRAIFLSFVHWDFKVVVQHGRYVVAHDPRGMLRCLERLAELSRAAVPIGLLLHSGSHRARGNHDHNSKPSGCRTAEVAGVEAIVTTIPEPTGCRTYGMCETFHFYVAIPLGLLLCSGSCRARGNHEHDSKPSERHAGEVTWVEAIVTRIHEPMGHHAYGMCETFCFRVAIPPLLSPALTDGRDLGPLVNAWVCPACSVGMKCHTQWTATCRGGQIGDGTHHTDPYLSCHMHSSPLPPAPLGFFIVPDHRSPAWLLSFLLRSSRWQAP
jgi:hypothetical protein